MQKTIRLELGESSELLIEAYEYFRSELEKSACDPGDVYRGIASLNIVDVSLDRGTDDPQLVIESMNSTDVDLRQSDLVRNYLLMGRDEPDQTRLYNEYWHRIESCFHASENAFGLFLRDYMALEQGSMQQIRPDRVYQEFKVFPEPGRKKTIAGVACRHGQQGPHLRVISGSRANTACVV